MKLYVETDNRIVKPDENKNKTKKDNKIIDNNKSTESLLESYGLTKNARILTE